MKTSVLAFAAVLVFSIALASPVHAGTAFSPPNYSYIGFAWYGNTSGDEPDKYPYGVHDAGLLPAIHDAELACRGAGFQACTFVAQHRDTGGCPAGNIEAPCYYLNLYENTTDQSKPTSKTGTGDTVYYAITDIIATISASPATIQQGDPSKLTWSESNEYVGSDDPATCSINNGIGSVPNSGSMNVSPAVTTKYTLTCNDGASDDADTASASATVTVNGGAASDLIASDVTTDPSEPAANEDTKLMATITNQGTGATGAGFTDLYEIDNNTDHDTLYGTVTDTSPALDPGGTDPSQATYSFPTAGTWYVRACADKRDQNDVDGVIAESNEDNNCSGDWTSITVTDSAAPNLTATYGGPSQATDEESTTLRGTIENPGNTSTGKSFVNVFEINPDQTTNDFNQIHALRTVSADPIGPKGHEDVSAAYTFDNEFDGWSGTNRTWYVRLCADTDTNNNGTIDESDEGDNCSAWAPVTVATQQIGDCAGPVTGNATAKPTRVATSTTSVISWRGVTGIPAGTSCSVVSAPKGNSSGTLVTSSDTCDVSDGSWPTGPIPTQTQFCFVCGSKTVSCAVVDVNPDIHED